MMLGFSLAYAPDLPIDRLSAATRRLLASNGWEKPLRYFTALTDPGTPMPRRPGSLKKAEVLDVAEEALRFGATTRLTMSTSARSDETFASVSVAPRLFAWSGQTQLHAHGKRPLGTPEGRVTWLTDVLQFACATSAFHGVVFAGGDWREVQVEGEILDGWSPGERAHPTYPEWARMSAHDRSVGTRYVRFPRWGTLYSHAHVAALGGVAKIVEVVQPAVVRELPGGVYVQLTDSLDTAQSEEATRKRRAFTELAEPLLPPPLPG